MQNNPFGLLSAELRRLLMPWAFSLLMPVPLILAGGPETSSDIATFYVGLGAAWLAVEVFRHENAPSDPSLWKSRIAAFLLCLLVNLALFSIFGFIGQVRSNIPWPMLMALGTTPSLGLIPWLVLKTRQPYAAIVLGGVTLGLIKLVGCVAARVVYGPDILAQGYIAADWNTAKLMISVMWGGSVSLSLYLAGIVYRRLTGSISAFTEKATIQRT